MKRGFEQSVFKLICPSRGPPQLTVSVVVSALSVIEDVAVEKRTTHAIIEVYLDGTGSILMKLISRTNHPPISMIQHRH